MKNKILNLALIMFGASIITSCGGSGGSDNTASDATGLFLDSAVAGLTYSSSPGNKTGKTDDLGQFHYKVGDTVEFSLVGTNGAKVVLGSAKGKSVIMPEDIADGENGTKTTKIGILLQSMDIDGNTANGIDIGTLTFNATHAATVLETLGSATLTTFTPQAFGSFTGKTVASATAALVTSATAKAHMATTKNSKPSVGMLGGKLVMVSTPNSIGSNKANAIAVKSSLLTTATAKVAVKAALDNWVTPVNSTYTYSWAETKLVAEFAKRGGASTDTVKIIIKMYGDNDRSRIKLYTECGDASICSAVGGATSTAYINSSTGDLIPLTASSNDKAASNITKGQVLNLSVALGGNDGSSTPTFAINGVTNSAADLGFTLGSSDIYDFTNVALVGHIKYPATLDAAAHSSFDDFTIDGTLEDNFNDGIDDSVWQLPVSF
jgi:hypothetical protein